MDNSIFIRQIKPFLLVIYNDKNILKQGIILNEGPIVIVNSLTDNKIITLEYKDIKQLATINELLNSNVITSLDLLYLYDNYSVFDLCLIIQKRANEGFNYSYISPFSIIKMINTKSNNLLNLIENEKVANKMAIEKKKCFDLGETLGNEKKFLSKLSKTIIYSKSSFSTLDNTIIIEGNNEILSTAIKLLEELLYNLNLNFCYKINTELGLTNTIINQKICYLLQYVLFSPYSNNLAAVITFNIDYLTLKYNWLDSIKLNNCSFSDIMKDRLNVSKSCYIDTISINMELLFSTYFYQPLCENYIKSHYLLCDQYNSIQNETLIYDCLIISIIKDVAIYLNGLDYDNMYIKKILLELLCDLSLSEKLKAILRTETLVKFNSINIQLVLKRILHFIEIMIIIGCEKTELCSLLKYSVASQLYIIAGYHLWVDGNINESRLYIHPELEYFNISNSTRQEYIYYYIMIATVFSKKLVDKSCNTQPCIELNERICKDIINLISYVSLNQIYKIVNQLFAICSTIFIELDAALKEIVRITFNTINNFFKISIKKLYSKIDKKKQYNKTNRTLQIHLLPHINVLNRKLNFDKYVHTGQLNEISKKYTISAFNNVASINFALNEYLIYKLACLKKAFFFDTKVQDYKEEYLMSDRLTQLQQIKFTCFNRLNNNPACLMVIIEKLLSVSANFLSYTEYILSAKYKQSKLKEIENYKKQVYNAYTCIHNCYNIFCICFKYLDHQILNYKYLNALAYHILTNLRNIYKHNHVIQFCEESEKAIPFDALLYSIFYFPNNTNSSHEFKFFYLSYITDNIITIDIRNIIRDVFIICGWRIVKDINILQQGSFKAEPRIDEHLYNDNNIKSKAAMITNYNNVIENSAKNAVSLNNSHIVRSIINIMDINSSSINSMSKTSVNTSSDRSEKELNVNAGKETKHFILDTNVMNQPTNMEQDNSRLQPNTNQQQENNKVSVYKTKSMQEYELIIKQRDENKNDQVLAKKTSNIYIHNNDINNHNSIGVNHTKSVNTLTSTEKDKLSNTSSKIPSINGNKKMLINYNDSDINQVEAKYQILFNRQNSVKKNLTANSDTNRDVFGKQHLLESKNSFKNSFLYSNEDSAIKEEQFELLNRSNNDDIENYFNEFGISETSAKNITYSIYDELENYFKKLCFVPTKPTKQIWTITCVANDENLDSTMKWFGVYDLLITTVETCCIKLNIYSFLLLYSSFVDQNILNKLTLLFTEFKINNDGTNADNLYKDENLLTNCRTIAYTILIDTLKIPTNAFLIGYSKIFFKPVTYYYILGKSYTILHKGSLNIFSNFYNNIHTLCIRTFFKAQKKNLIRIQAKWRMKLYQFKLLQNRLLYFPILQGIIRAGTMLIPYIGVNNKLYEIVELYGKQAKPLYQNMKKNAAIKLVAWWKHILAKKKYKELKINKVRDNAREFIQTLLRTLVSAVSVSHRLKQSHTLESSDHYKKFQILSIIKIQSWIKIHINKDVIRAKTIINGFRGVLIPIKIKTDKLANLTAIQKYIKLKYKRSNTINIKNLLEEYEKKQHYHDLFAIRIQSRFRAFFISQQFGLLKRSAQVLQIYIHAQLYRRRFLVILLSSIKIQKWWKSYLLLKGFNKNNNLWVAARPRNIKKIPEEIYKQRINNLLYYINLPRNMLVYKKKRKLFQTIFEQKFTNFEDSIEYSCITGLSAMIKRPNNSIEKLLVEYMDINVYNYYNIDKSGGEYKFYGKSLSSHNYIIEAAYCLHYNFDKNYTFFDGFFYPLFTFLLRYLISATSRYIRKTNKKTHQNEKSTQKLYEVILSIYSQSSSIEKGIAKLDANIVNNGSKPNKYSNAAKELLKNNSLVNEDEKQKKCNYKYEFSYDDLRQLMLIFESTYLLNNPSKKVEITKDSVENILLNLQREQFEITDIKVANSFGLILVKEDLEKFLGITENSIKSLINHQFSENLTNIFGDSVNCVFGWGSNKFFQLTFEGPGLPIKAKLNWGKRLSHLPIEGGSYYDISVAEFIRNLCSEVELVNLDKSNDDYPESIKNIDFSPFAELGSLYLIKIVHVMSDSEYEWFKKTNRVNKRKNESNNCYKLKKNIEEIYMSNRVSSDSEFSDSSIDSNHQIIDEKPVQKSKVISLKKGEIRHGAKTYEVYDENMKIIEKRKRRHIYKRVIDYTFRIVAVEVGEDFAVALTNDGKLFSWGSNKNGRCGQGPKYELIPEPRLIPFVSDFGNKVLQISVAKQHCICLTENNKTYIWGAYAGVHLLQKGESDIYWPVQIPVDKLLYAKDGTKLDLIRLREKLKFETDEPAFAYSAVNILNDDVIPKFGTYNEEVNNTFIQEKLDNTQYGAFSNEDLEVTLGLTTKEERRKLLAEREIWEREYSNDNDYDERILNRMKKRQEATLQRQRRAKRRADHNKLIIELTKTTKEAAKKKFEKLKKEGKTYEELEAMGIIELNKTQIPGTNKKKVNVIIKVPNVIVPPMEQDTDKDISEPSEDEEENAYFYPYFDAIQNTISGVSEHPNFSSWKQLTNTFSINPEARAVDNYNFEESTYPKPRSKNYKRKIYIFDWHGVSKDERRWLQQVELIRSVRWNVIRVCATNTINIIHMRADEIDLVKDILIIWGGVFNGQLGFHNELNEKDTKNHNFKMQNQDEDNNSFIRNLGWCPLFFWFGDKNTLRDRNYKILDFSCGYNCIIAIIVYGNKKYIFLWGTFRVHKYNLIRSITHINEEVEEKEKQGTLNSKPNIFKLLTNENNSNAKKLGYIEESPYALEPENTKNENVIGCVAFSSPIQIRSEEIEYDEIKHVWSNPVRYEIIITCWNYKLNRHLIYAFNEIECKLIQSQKKIRIEKGPELRIDQSSARFPIIKCNPSLLNSFTFVPSNEYYYLANHSPIYEHFDNDYKVNGGGTNPQTLFLYRKKSYKV